MNMTAVEELMDHLREVHGPSPELERVRDFHLAHPEVLDFLVQEIRLLISNERTAFSYVSLWNYARWQIAFNRRPEDSFKMPAALTPYYARLVVILFPEFNGLSQFCRAKADKFFGTRIESAPKKRPKHYALRLQWADGAAIEHGWRPSTPHEPKPVNSPPSIHGKPPASVRPASGEQYGS